MAIDLTKSPYHDDFDPTDEFLQILAVPGRALQAREFTQAQSILRHSIKRLSETLMRDGNIVSGMDFNIEDNELHMEGGLVYIQGFIHDFKAQSVTLTGEGEERVGVKVVETIVTATEDNSLRDPASGFVNYSNPGADRLKSTAVLTLNDDDASTIYRFLDGSLIKSSSPVERDVLNDTLAQRTYDESGNYRVNGFALYTEEGPNDDIMLTIDSGKAYVLGYEVDKPTPTRISVEKSRATRTINNESKFYNSSNQRYALNNNPVQQITRVNAEVRVTKAQMVRGTQVSGSDFLPKQSVSTIERVWQENADGSTAKEFTIDTDYQLTDAQAITWQESGEEPGIGDSYFVTFRYNKVMAKDTDYHMVYEGETENRRYYLEFLTPGGDVPVDGTQFYVDYDFYLARKDLITLDKDGNIRVIDGQPDIPRLVATPSNNDPNSLSLGTVFISADSTTSVPNAYSVTRLDMSDLQGLMRRIHDIEYNQAVNHLDSEAIASEQASELRGVFSDGFWNMSKADLFHEDFSVAFSLEDGQIMLPTVGTNVEQPAISSGSQIHQWGRIVSTPMTEERTLHQPHSTGTMSVNPYAVYNTMGVIELTPKIDNWVEEDRVTLEHVTTSTHRVRRWWFHAGMQWNDTERFLFDNLTFDRGEDGWRGWDRTQQGTIERGSSINILNESIQFMRQRSVRFFAKNLTRGANNLELTFDGRRVDITPTNGFVAGDDPGTLRANMSGHARGRFMVPSGVRTGTREVVLKNDNNMAITSYTAQGRKRTVQTTIFTERVTVQAYDPLAQSFQFDRDRILTSFGVYFSSVPLDNSNVVFQVRNMVNGYPGTTIYAEKVAEKGEITPTYHATQEFKVTFDDPVMCKANTQYCITIISDSPDYALFYSELGGVRVENNPDRDPSIRVLSQPYLEGTLFSSANAITWTAHQTKDLKFNLYTATFAPEGVIEFDPITGLDIDRMVLFSEHLTPTNTGCTWEIRILHKDQQGTLGAQPYEPIANYVDIDLSEVAEALQLRATFKADRYMSPMLAIDGVSLIGMMTGLEGAYVGRNVVFPEASRYTTITQTFDAHIPNGCTVKPYYSTDGGATWIENSATPVIEPVNDLFSRYTYFMTASGGPHSNFKAKLVMTSLNSVARPRASRFINIAK